MDGTVRMINNIELICTETIPTLPPVEMEATKLQFVYCGAAFIPTESCSLIKGHII